MKFEEVLSILYSKDLPKIISVLNSSVYSKDWKVKDDKYFIFHLGFVFRIQTGTQMELLYDLTSNIVIRQPRLPARYIPPMLGLNCYYMDDRLLWSHYINGWSKVVMVAYDQDNELLCYYSLPDGTFQTPLKNLNNIELFSFDSQEKYTYSQFEIINKAREVIAEYPLHKSLSEIVFYNGLRFEKKLF